MGQSHRSGHNKWMVRNRRCWFDHQSLFSFLFLLIIHVFSSPFLKISFFTRWYTLISHFTSFFHSLFSFSFSLTSLFTFTSFHSHSHPQSLPPSNLSLPPINQSINHSFNHSFIQPFNHSINHSFNHSPQIWDLARGTLRLTLTGHISTVRGLAIAPNNPYLYSCGEDKSIKCWDLEYNKVLLHIFALLFILFYFILFILKWVFDKWTRELMCACASLFNLNSRWLFCMLCVYAIL